MLEVPVYNMEGREVDTFKVDDDVFGSKVNADLLKQAVVAYHAQRHQGTAKTRSRGEIKGSRHKMFRQKGTGFARRGSKRTNILRGGGVAFAKNSRPPRNKMPQKMRKAALKSALLAKIIGGDLLILDELKIEQPKTSRIADVLEKLSINRSCLLALPQHDRNVYLSARNVQDLAVCSAEELNAYDVAIRQKMIITTQAMQELINRSLNR